MSAALRSLDPLHTAYLNWHHLLRNLIAQAVPALLAVTPDQLLQLKLRLEQADSNADGFLTEPELLSVDMEPLLNASTASLHKEGQQEGMSRSSVAEVADDSGTVVSEGSNEKQYQDIAVSAGDDQDSPVEANDQKAMAQLKHLCFQMLENNAAEDAAVSIEEILLYFCCDSNATAGLRKAHAVVTGSLDGQVALKLNMVTSKQVQVWMPTKMHSHVALKLVQLGTNHPCPVLCRQTSSSSTSCLPPLTQQAQLS